MEFRVGSGFCDLNLVSSGDVVKDKALIRRALQLGYTTVALNTLVDQKDLSTGRKSKKAAEISKQAVLTDFPPPPKIPELNPSVDYPALNAKGQSPVILKRLTITLNSNDFLPIYNNSASVKSYDLVAIIPTSALTLQNLLKSGFRADIVSFHADPDLSGGGGGGGDSVKWNRKLYREVAEKHMVLEVCYGPAINDSATRRKVIRQTHIYHSVGKSRSIVLSSGARSGIELRSPHDVINLGHGLFNLNEQQAKNSLTKLATDAVKSGAGRRLGPFRAVAQLKSQLAEQESWKIPSDPKSESGIHNQDCDDSDSSNSDDNDSASDEPMKVYE